MSIPGEYIKQGETTEEGILKILNKYRRKKKSLWIFKIRFITIN